MSFSNIVDENSNELYKGLSDGDLVVKKNTLVVLTHLILNGMIKVEGQLGEMTKCRASRALRSCSLQSVRPKRTRFTTACLMVRLSDYSQRQPTHTISHSHQSAFNW